MSRSKGFSFEDEFVNEASARGVIAYRILKSHPYDVVANGLRIQCKAKTIDSDNRIQIGKGQNLYRKDEWDILALKCRGVVYLIPANRLRSERVVGFLKRKIHSFDIQQWRDRWDLLETMKSEGSHGRESQRSLF
jgi:hypothetical protein